MARPGTFSGKEGCCGANFSAVSSVRSADELSTAISFPGLGLRKKAPSLAISLGVFSWSRPGVFQVFSRNSPGLRPGDLMVTNGKSRNSPGKYLGESWFSLLFRRQRFTRGKHVFQALHLGVLFVIIANATPSHQGLT